MVAALATIQPTIPRYKEVSKKACRHRDCSTITSNKQRCLTFDHEEGADKVTKCVKDHDGTTVKDLLGVAGNVVGDRNEKQDVTSSVGPSQVETQKLCLGNRNDNQQQDANDGNEQEGTGTVKSVAIATIIPDSNDNEETVSDT